MEGIMQQEYVIGIDEVGRGPVAGPLVVCACALLKNTDMLQLFPKGKLKDSKKLTEKVRAAIVEQLSGYKEGSVVVSAIGEVSAEIIDAIGLSSSIKKAVKDALEGLHSQGVSRTSFVFLDGSLAAPEEYQQQTIIKGDEKIIEISLASIIAKVYRDTLMKRMAGVYPSYGFENHVGYGTKAHYEAIAVHGLTPLHRKSFLKSVLQKG